MQTFLAVKEGIELRDLGPVADLLSDGVYDDLSQDVLSLLARDAIQHFDGLAPSSVMVVAADRGPQGDAITLRIQAVATQYLGSADAGSNYGLGVAGPFTEFWTFSRLFEGPRSSREPMSVRRAGRRSASTPDASATTARCCCRGHRRRPGGWWPRSGRRRKTRASRLGPRRGCKGAGAPRGLQNRLRGAAEASWVGSIPIHPRQTF